MSKQIETPANEEQGSQLEPMGSQENGENQLPPFPPRPEPETAHANGWDVAGQYRALQEAQLLHEETLKQLRDEVQFQKERISELSDLTSSSGHTPQLDAVFLRLSELERKIGQDAPDPLLNEIVHRLAALENNPRQAQGGKDSRVDDLVEQVEKLRRKSSEPVGDSRVDDVVLRIASLESSNKRANVSSEIESLGARLQEARTELEESRRADLDVFRQELQTLSERVQALTESDDSAERFESVERRLNELSESSAEARIELETKIDDAVERLPEPVDAEQEAARWQALETRLEKIEQGPDPVSETAHTALVEQVESIREQLEQLRERIADIPASSRLADLEARLDEVVSKLSNPEPSEETAALRERIFTLEDRVTGEDGYGVRISALEDAGPATTAMPEEWVQKAERLNERLDELEELVERVSKIEREDGDSNRAGLLELTSRLRTLELKGEDLENVTGRVDDLRAELEALRGSGSVGELRTELEALKEQSARDESEELRTRIGEIAGRLSDIESVNRIESTGSRLDALEDKLRGLDDLSEIRRRLTVLEMGPRDKDSTRSDEWIARLEAIEARPTGSGGDVDLTAVDERLEEIQARLAEVEARPATVVSGDGAVDESWRGMLAALEQRLGLVEAAEPAGADAARLEALSDRIAELETRTGEQGAVVVDADARARIESLADDFERMRQAAVESGVDAVPDPRVSELINRVEWIEKSAGGDDGGVDLESLRSRLEALEQQPQGGSPDDDSLRSRMQEMLDRLDHLEGQGPGGDGALQKESERWSQWARSTLEEIGELRRQIEEVQGRSPAAAGGGAAGGLDAEAVEAIGASISAGLSKGEVRSLRQQMYFIYFAIGTLLALAVLFLFKSLTG